MVPPTSTAPPFATSAAGASAGEDGVPTSAADPWRLVHQRHQQPRRPHRVPPRPRLGAKTRERSIADRSTTARIVVHVVCDEATAAGTADHPGFLANHGVISADHIHGIVNRPDTTVPPLGRSSAPSETAPPEPKPPSLPLYQQASPYRPSAALDTFIRIRDGYSAPPPDATGPPSPASSTTLWNTTIATPPPAGTPVPSGLPLNDSA